jgi:pimeloyl-ACP methyl ester carboxylesterase
MRKQPETTYAKADDGYVAYQLFGRGPLDIVFNPAWATNVDVMWEEPSLARYLDRLASFGRVICFDKRGSGVSDPVPLTALPSLEQWMDDTRVAMDAAGSDRAALIGDTEGGPMVMLFAATYPDRVQSLVLINSFARMIRDDDYPIGLPPEVIRRMLAGYESTWGRPEFIDTLAPSVAGDDRFRSWFARYMRLSMGRGQSTTMYGQGVLRFDVRAILPSIRVPTLVVQRADALWHRAAYGRYLAEHIPGAKYIELSGADTVPLPCRELRPDPRRGPGVPDGRASDARGRQGTGHGDGSPTSSDRPSGPRTSATSAGSTCATGTTASCGVPSSGSAAGR